MKNLRKLDKYRISMEHFGIIEDDPSKEGFFEMRVGNDFYSVVASTGAGWDHVSVSGRYGIPSHEVVSSVKDRFFNSDEVAVEIHPKKSEYINNHSRCLHLWRPTNAKLPVPKFYEFDNAPSDAEGSETITVDGRTYEVRYKKALDFERIEVVGSGKHPTWLAMNAIKEHYFGDEVVVQYHPRTIDSKQDKNNTLVLWRPLLDKMPTPPKELVGIEGLIEEDFANKSPEQILQMVDEALDKKTQSTDETEPEA